MILLLAKEKDKNSHTKEIKLKKVKHEVKWKVSYMGWKAFIENPVVQQTVFSTLVWIRYYFMR